jgi:hypothetical protein
MHHVRREVPQDPLVVGDQEHTHLRPFPAHLVDTLRDDLQGVDVEAGVGLVEDRHVGLQQRQLQHLGALLLAAGEAVVQIAVHEPGVDGQSLHPVHERQAHLQHRHVEALPGRHRLTQEVEDGDAGELFRVLEAEEHAPLGPLLGRQLGDVLALEPEAAGADLVVRAGQQCLGQGGLPGPVGAHENVDLAGCHGE